MADNINALIASKKQLIDGIAHELRTPLVRLRYRLEMSENLTGAESQALNRDIGQLEALIEELLTYARLDRPQTELHLSTPDLPVWLQTHINDVQSVNPQRKLLTAITPGAYGALDMRLMERVLDNLMNNAMRYSETTLRIGLDLQEARRFCVWKTMAPALSRRSVKKFLSRLCASIPAATGLPAAVVWGWLLSVLLPRRWAVRFAAKRASWVGPGSSLAGRSITTFPSRTCLT